VGAAGVKSEEEAGEAMSSVSDSPLLSSAVVCLKHSRNVIYVTNLDYMTGLYSRSDILFDGPLVG
jgi:hypothetical protein